MTQRTRETKNVVLIMGPPNSGKSHSIKNLDQERVWVINPDNKEVPFVDELGEMTYLDDPLDIFDDIAEAEEDEHIDTVVLDTITFAMQNFERQVVNTASNTQKAWGDYGDYYREMLHTIKNGTKNYAILAHEDTVVDEDTKTRKVVVPVKGAVRRIGVEADFSIILLCQQVPVKKLEGHENDLLTITPEEEEDGIKRVFVTRLTQANAGAPIRTPNGLFARNELYIDNDLKLVFERLAEFNSGKTRK